MPKPFYFWRIASDREAKSGLRAVEHALVDTGYVIWRVLVPARFKEALPEIATEQRIALGCDDYVLRLEKLTARNYEPTVALPELLPSTLSAGDSAEITEYRHPRGYFGHRLHARIGGTTIRAAALDVSVPGIRLSLVGPEGAQVDAVFEQVLQSLVYPEHRPTAVAFLCLARRHSTVRFRFGGTKYVDEHVLYEYPNGEWPFGEVFLGNLEQAVARHPDGPVTGAARYFDMATLCFPSPRSGWKLKKTAIFPYACDERWLPGDPRPHPSIDKEFVEGRRVVCVAEDRGVAVLLTELQVEKIGLNWASTMAAAYKNLDARVAKARRLKRYKRGKVVMVAWRDCRFAAGLVAVPLVIHKAYARIFGDPVGVAVPSSHDLILFNTREKTVVRRATELVEQIYACSPHPLTTTLFEMTARKLRPLGTGEKKAGARRPSRSRKPKPRGR